MLTKLNFRYQSKMNSQRKIFQFEIKRVLHPEKFEDLSKYPNFSNFNPAYFKGIGYNT